MTDFYAGAYWGPRSEPLDVCAHRIADFATRIASVHADLGTWYEREGPGSPARRVSSVGSSIKNVLLAGRSRRDTDASAMNALGYRIALWNGREPGAGLSIRCGAVDPNVTNSCILQLPTDATQDHDLLRIEGARGIVRAQVEAWEPDWATWTSDRWRRLQGASGDPVVGLVTYLGPRYRVNVDALPPQITTESLHVGSLISAGGLREVSEGVLLAIARAIQR